MTKDSEDRIQMFEIFGVGVVFLAAAIGWVCFAYYTDYPGETLYVVSILCTMAISGFLSIYARQQREVKGALLFMLIELGVSFLALFEILSIFSQTQGQALFWFNMRFLLTAFIPVGWLAFVLTFSGQIRLISRRLMAGMLVIPAITQLMLWSNSLHGLWIMQDVGFYQTGPFWIAETSSRVPAFWFMVHSFYSLLLGLIAAGFLLQVAWKKRQTYRAQALLFTIGTLISLSTSLIPIFNFISQSGFNPFIPGLGISALFYALAVFRFDFLKRFTRGESTSSIQTLDTASFRSMMLFIFIFLLMATGLASIGYMSYQNYERQFRIRVESELSAIADLKINGLENWRTERLGDARILNKNPILAALVQRAFENPADEQAQVDIQAWLQSITRNSQYDRVTLLDTQAVERFSAPDSPRSVPSHLKEIQESLRTKQITFLDFHRDLEDGSIHLKILIPLLTGENADKPVGVLMLRIDPEKYVYPFINEWPVASTSAETLIVRQDGNDILYLNDLRFNSSAALNLRIPLGEVEVPEVRAANGQEGIFEGVDYRGEQVLADAHPVPNTSWFLVSKIDTAEIFAPLRNRAWETFFLVVAWILGAGAGLGAIWRQQRLRYYRAQYETAESLRKSENRYRELVQQASDGIFLTDPQTNYIEVNQRGCDMLGYSRSEILTMKIADLIAPEDLTNSPPRLQELREGKTLITERRLKRKDGSLLPVEISASMFPDGRFQSIVRDITDRKQAEEKLHESESRYRLIAENSADVIWVLDPVAEKFTYVSPSVERLRGYTPQEVMAQPINETLTPQSLKKVSESLARNLPRFIAKGSGTESYINELDQPCKDGSIVHTEVTTTYLFNEQGKVEVVGVSRDITERKQVEEALHQSEAKFSKAFTSNPAAIILSRLADGLQLDVNDAYCRLVGFSREELLGHPAMEFNIFIYPEQRLELVEQLKANGSIRNLEITLRNKMGELHPVLISVERLEFNREECILTTLVDITESKQAEKKLEQQNQRLKTLRDIDTAILAADSVENIVGAALEHVRELIGCERANLALIDWETNEAVNFDVKDVKESAISKGARVSLDAVQDILRVLSQNQAVLIKDLTLLPDPLPQIRIFIKEGLRSRCILPLLSQGKVLGSLTLSSNIPDYFDDEKVNLGREVANQIAIAISQNTLLNDLRILNASLEQRVAQRTAELKKINIELEHANHAKDEFLATMSHELRTPLNSILGMSESLLEQLRDPLSEYQQRSLRTIASSGSHLLELINDILDLSKVEAGKFDCYPQIIGVDDLCRSSLAFVKEQATRKSITLTYKNEQTVLRIYADPRRLKQILINLLTNAVKFTPEHGQVILHIDADIEQGRILFSVVDTGIGIAPDNLRQLFLPFSQVDSSLTRKYQGTGLGLALVQKLTDLHGGSVDVESEVGRGSRFTVNLPIGQAIMAQQETGEIGGELLATQTGELNNSSARSIDRGKILLAEDNMANILTIGEYLESHGYQIVVAHNGFEALEKAEEIHPNLFLMDIQMPAMDGLEAIRRLRAGTRFATTPIIALTALAMPGDRERCLDAGANEYMSKPVSLKSLAKTIEMLLNTSKSSSN